MSFLRDWIGEVAAGVIGIGSHECVRYIGLGGSVMLVAVGVLGWCFLGSGRASPCDSGWSGVAWHDVMFVG